MRLGSFEKGTWGRNWTQLLPIARIWGGRLFRTASTFDHYSQDFKRDYVKRYDGDLRTSPFVSLRFFRTPRRQSLNPNGAQAGLFSLQSVQRLNRSERARYFPLPQRKPRLRHLVWPSSRDCHRSVIALRQSYNLALRRPRDTRKIMSQSVPPELWRSRCLHDPGQTAGTGWIQEVALPPRHREPVSNHSPPFPLEDT